MIDGNKIPEQPINKSGDTKLSRITTRKMVIAIIAMAIFLIVMELAFAFTRHQDIERIQLDANDSIPVSSIFEAPNGDIWVRNYNNTWQFDGGDINRFTIRDDIFSTGVSDFTVAPNGSFWWIFDQSVANLDGKIRTQYDFFDRINAIEIEPNGIVWLGTENGIMRLVDEEWQIFSYADGLNANDVDAIELAPNGGIWLAASVKMDDGYVGSLSYFDGKNFTKAYSLAGKITTIDIDPDGVLWVGTNQGVSRFDGNEWTTYTTKDGLLDNYVGAIVFGPDKTIWFEASNGISQFDGEKWRMLLPFSSSVRIGDIFVDDQNNLWVASFTDGLYVYDVSRIMVPVQLFKGWQLLRKFLGSVVFLLLLIIGFREAPERLSKFQKAVFISLFAGLLAGGIGYVIIMRLILVSELSEGLMIIWLFCLGPVGGIIIALITIYEVYRRLS